MSASWSGSWVEGRSIEEIGRFLLGLLLPGALLMFWFAAERPSWGMSASVFVFMFVYIPYAFILALVLLFRLLKGGAEHTAKLSLSREGGGGMYREDGRWSLQSSCLGEVRRVSFSLRELEGFTGESFSTGDGALWCRVMVWQKRQPPEVLFERLPQGVASDAMVWLREKTGAGAPVFGAPLGG